MGIKRTDLFHIEHLATELMKIMGAVTVGEMLKQDQETRKRFIELFSALKKFNDRQRF